MANDQMSAVLRHLEKTVHGQDGPGKTDGQLLDSFLRHRDEDAFEALVRRHGPMVLGVCRRILRHTQDAEDAFQTVFLVLARKAASVQQRELLGNWLYGVAYRAALETRAARRRVREREVVAMPEPEVVDEPAVWSDLRPVLDRELNRLPEKYREAIVLCDLQGQTRREVARQLGLPEGTLSGRLTTARRLLARRLARHAPALSGGALAAVLSQGAAEASLPAALVASATRMAAGSAGSARVAALTEGVMKTMLLGKLQSVTALLLAVVLVAAAAGFAVLSARAPRPAGREPATLAKPMVVQEDAIIRQVAWSTDGKTLATVGLTLECVKIKDDAGKDTGHGIVLPNMTLKLWDAQTGKLRQSLDEERHTNIMATAFSPDGKTAAVAMVKLLAKREQDIRDRPKLQVRIVDARTWKLRYVVEQEGGVSALAFSPDGTRLAFGGRSRLTQDAAFVKLWDVRKRKLIGTTEGSGFHVSHLAFSRDGKLLASGDMKGKVRLLDGLTGKSIWVLDGHTEYVSGVGFSPDGKTLISGSTDKTLKLWGVESGKRLRTLNTRTPVSALAFSRDRRQLATAGWVKAKQHEILVWDTKTWEVKKSIPGQTVTVCALAFSPDSGVLAIGGGNSIRLDPNTPGGRQKSPGEFKLIPLASLPALPNKPDARQQRRESTYSVRAVLRVMPPFNRKELSDDYQDVRVRKVTREFVELEVVVFPFNTNAESIKGNPSWKKDYAGMKEYLAPGITTNWDDEMRKDLLGELASDGIHPDRLTDKEVVEQVSRWLFRRSRQRNMFCTFYVGFAGGKPKVLPGLERAFERDKGDPKWTAREQFEHELLGKEMFARKTYGTCTSAAVYQTTVLRALGIPTRVRVHSTCEGGLLSARSGTATGEARRGAFRLSATGHE